MATLGWMVIFTWNMIGLIQTHYGLMKVRVPFICRAGIYQEFQRLTILLENCFSISRYHLPILLMAHLILEIICCLTSSIILSNWKMEIIRCLIMGISVISCLNTVTVFLGALSLRSWRILPAILFGNTVFHLHYMATLVVVCRFLKTITG